MGLKHLVLGTVQLGMNYGVNNKTGKPDIESAHAILDHAYRHRVYALDTAADYCESENVIGGYIEDTGKLFRICTKLPSKLQGDVAGAVCEETRHSLGRLRTDKIEVYYLHRFEQCRDTGIIKAMGKLKADGTAAKLGVSVYEPRELEYIVTELKGIVDVVQLPLNVLNAAVWLSSGLLSAAKRAAIDIYVRSVYLQGLIFMAPDDPFVNKVGAGRYIALIRELCAERRMSLSELALGFVNSVPEVDAVLLGCETLAQHMENIAVYESEPRLPEEDVQRIATYCADIPPEAVDPRLWSGR